MLLYNTCECSGRLFCATRYNNVGLISYGAEDVASESPKIHVFEYITVV